jgi:transcriptional regulator with XRE-family HTH domain
VDRTYVSGIERREFNPSVDLLDRLATALAVDILDLLAECRRAMRPYRHPCRRDESGVDQALHGMHAMHGLLRG